MTNHRCAFGCGSVDVTHRIPNPRKFPRMFEIWVRILEEQVNITLSKDNYRKLRICSKHFKNEHRNRNNRLNALAVPTLHLPKATSHRFPNPIKYPKTFEAWARIIKEKVNITVPKHMWDNVTLCDKHFERKFWNRNKRLNISAVPTLRLYMTNEKYDRHRKNDSLPDYRLRSVPGYVVDFEDYLESVSKHLENAKKVSISTEKCEVNWRSLPKWKLEEKLGNDVHSDHPYSRESVDKGPEWRAQGKKPWSAIDSVKSEEEETESQEALTEYLDDDFDSDCWVDDSQAPSMTASSKEESKKKSEPLFSWEKSVELIATDAMDVGCPTIGDDIGTAQTPVDISLYDDDPVIVSDNHAEYYCNECCKEIIGFRYTCVQCVDWDLCGACEARELHAAHYVLRVPSPRPYNDIQAILGTIRQQLLSENLMFNNAISIKVKEEPKDEPEAGNVRTESGPDPLEESARNVEEHQGDRTKELNTGSRHRKRLKSLKTDQNPPTGRIKLSTLQKYVDTLPKPTKIDENPKIPENTSMKTPQTIPPPKLQVVTKYGKVHTKLKPVAPEKVPRKLNRKGIDKVLSRFKRKSSNATLLLRLPPGSDPMDIARALKSKVVVRPLKIEDIERIPKSY